MNADGILWAATVAVSMASAAAIVCAA